VLRRGLVYEAAMNDHIFVTNQTRQDIFRKPLNLLCYSGIKTHLI
jgi:hypothetical protein